MQSRKVKLLFAIAVAMVAVGMAGTAVASATETPGWIVGGNRLLENQEETVEAKTPAGHNLTLGGAINDGSTVINININITIIFINQPIFIGSCWRCDGKAANTIQFENAKVLTKEAGAKEYTEQKGCEINNFESKPLSGKIWLEGSKSAGSPNPVLVYNEKEGKNIVAEVAIKKAAGKACNVLEKEVGKEIEAKVEKKFTLEGDVGAQIEIAGGETAKATLNFPNKPVTPVWQPPGNQEGEETLGLEFAGQTASLAGEVEVELKSKAKFGVVIQNRFRAEGTHWVVDGGTLTEALEVQGVSSSGYLESTVGGLALTITCKSANTSPTAGTNQIEKEGKSKTKIEFSNCQAWEIIGGSSISQPECKITEPIIAEATGKLEGAGENLFTGSKAEETLAEIAIAKSEKCAFTKVAELKLKIKATELCTLPLLSEESVVHEMICTPGGSKLKASTEIVRMWSTELLRL